MAKTANIHVKIDEGLKQDFRKKCVGRDLSKVILEFIEAFVDDRVKITPTAEQQQAMELYQP